jgi:hypothetical protein
MFKHLHSIQGNALLDEMMALQTAKFISLNFTGRTVLFLREGFAQSPRLDDNSRLWAIRQPVLEAMRCQGGALAN